MEDVSLLFRLCSCCFHCICRDGMLLLFCDVVVALIVCVCGRGC